MIVVPTVLKVPFLVGVTDKLLVLSGCNTCVS